MTDETIGYEQARDELVEVVRRLETGGVGLEESLALWERGEALAAICEQWLAGPGPGWMRYGQSPSRSLRRLGPDERQVWAAQGLEAGAKLLVLRDRGLLSGAQRTALGLGQRQLGYEEAHRGVRLALLDDGAPELVLGVLLVLLDLGRHAHGDPRVVGYSGYRSGPHGGR